MIWIFDLLKYYEITIKTITEVKIILAEREALF